MRYKSGVNFREHVDALMPVPDDRRRPADLRRVPPAKARAKAAPRSRAIETLDSTNDRPTS